MMGNNMSIAAAVGGGLFLAYCVYFDYKRRSDPQFKQKLKTRREEAKQRAHAKNSTTFPNMNDFEAVQKFFISEVQLGEDSIGQGDEDQAVEHLSNAIAVCGQPQSLLQVFAQTLPEDVFKRILERLPIVTQKIRMIALSQMSGGRGQGPVLFAGDSEDDVSIGRLLNEAAGNTFTSSSSSTGPQIGIVPSHESKTSTAFIDDDVE